MRTSPAQLTAASAAIKFVCARYNVTLAQLEGPSRKRRFAWPRFISMYLCHEQCGLGWRVIGHLFNRYPSAVHHACRRVSDWIATEPRTAKEVAEVTNAFRAYFPES